jgi:fido (protein-threonine AMPylation protein)
VRESTACDGDARRWAEADLVANRLAALYEEPLTGDFDLAHLRAIHAWLFQDPPHHQPGVIRSDTEDGWIKRRMLEDETLVYAVPYLHRGVAARIAVILKRFGGVGALSGRTPRAAARRMAGLYADLDHAHGFHEGNSRTLREFTRSLAEVADFTLDWIGTGVGASERNQLYLAREAFGTTATGPIILEIPSFICVTLKFSSKPSGRLLNRRYVRSCASWMGCTWWTALISNASCSSTIRSI